MSLNIVFKLILERKYFLCIPFLFCLGWRKSASTVSNPIPEQQSSSPQEEQSF
jgi:hypothetical protein